MDQAEQLRNIIKAGNVKRSRPLARVITVTSGKGGVGKSNTAINLAIQFRKMGKKVVILDADFGLANIEIMFGAVPKHNLSDLIYQGKNIKDIITWGPMEVGFISGGSGLKELTNLNHEQLQMLVRMMYELDNLADIVIIDTGAGISDTVVELVLASSELLLVATPEPTSLTDAYALIKTLSRHEEFYEDNRMIRMVANRTHSAQEGTELYEKLSSVVAKFLKVHIDYLGQIPYDEKLSKAIMKQQPVALMYPNAASSRALMEIATCVERGLDRPAEGRQGLSGLFSKMFHNKKN